MDKIKILLIFYFGLNLFSCNEETANSDIVYFIRYYDENTFSNIFLVNGDINDKNKWEKIVKEKKGAYLRFIGNEMPFVYYLRGEHTNEGRKETIYKRDIIKNNESVVFTKQFDHGHIELIKCENNSIIYTIEIWHEEQANELVKYDLRKKRFDFLYTKEKDKVITNFDVVFNDNNQMEGLLLSEKNKENENDEDVYLYHLNNMKKEKIAGGKYIGYKNELGKVIIKDRNGFYIYDLNTKSKTQLPISCAEDETIEKVFLLNEKHLIYETVKKVPKLLSNLIFGDGNIFSDRFTYNKYRYYYYDIINNKVMNEIKNNYNVEVIDIKK